MFIISLVLSMVIGLHSCLFTNLCSAPTVYNNKCTNWLSPMPTNKIMICLKQLNFNNLDLGVLKEWPRHHFGQGLKRSRYNWECRLTCSWRYSTYKCHVQLLRWVFKSNLQIISNKIWLWLI